MRIALAAVLVFASSCGGGEADAPPDAPYVPPPPPPPCNQPTYFCNANFGDACGNNQIDSCYYQSMPGHCTYYPGGVEACDGTARPSCAELGFPGGTTSCVDCRLVVECDACAAGGTCVTRSGSRGSDIAANGTRLAVLASTAGASSVLIYDGPTFVSETPVTQAGAVIRVGQGWLLGRYQPHRLTPLDMNGVLGADVMLSDEMEPEAMAYGPGGRVLVAWSRQVDTQYETRAALVDTSGNTTIGPFTLFTSGAWHVSATTDGTSFFVGSGGKLARIAPDGTFSVATGFSDERVTDLSWHGTTGSFLATGDAGYPARVRRFDATGAPIGTLRTLGITALDSVANGDELVVIGLASQNLGFVRVAADGTSAAGAAIGVISSGSRLAHVDHLGAQIVVTWNAPSLQLKFVDP